MSWIYNMKGLYKLYTNGFYIINAVTTNEPNEKDRKLNGHIIGFEGVETLKKYTAYNIGDCISFNLYNNTRDNSPQFKLTKKQLRADKLNELLP